VARALEHQVLEQVRKPSPAFRLDAESDVIVDPDRDGRGSRVARQDDFQTIVELVVVDRDVDRGIRHGRRYLRGGCGGRPVVRWDGRLRCAARHDRGRDQRTPSPANRADWHRGAYLGAMRMAPSMRITSPFNMRFVQIAATSSAYSSGRPRRGGK